MLHFSGSDRYALGMEDERTDQALVDAANRGETSAMEALYYRHRGWVYGVARKITGQDGDAQEVAQDAFTYFFDRFPGFELRSSLKAYLYPVIRNKSLDLIRKRRPMTLLSDALPAEPERDEFHERLRLGELVSDLPEGLREVVVLRFVDGMQMNEIGVELGIPAGTVKSRLHKALDTLRKKSNFP